MKSEPYIITFVT